MKRLAISLFLFLSVAAALAFDPTDIAGLKGWWKADSLSLTDGDPVSSWSDSSGNSQTLTNGSNNTPVYKTTIFNCKPVVRFEAVSAEALSTSASWSLASSTIFVYGALDTIPLGQASYSPFVIFGSGSTGARLCGVLSSTNWGTFASGDLSAGEDLVFFVPNILEMTTTSGSTILYRDGTSKASGGNHSTGGETVLVVGAEPGAGRFLDADIAEVIVYDSVLSTGDRQSVEAYLTAKYACASPTPTPTATPASTPTATPTSTPSNQWMLFFPN